jgi:hypothetical protein
MAEEKTASAKLVDSVALTLFATQSQMAAHGKIFVSYRRDDAPGDARSIYERLGRSFGEGNAFMDVDQLLAGQRFDRELDKALAECEVLIAVIGARWMDLLSEYEQHGKRDYVRDEIAAALQRDIIVIPVMMGREANMPPLPLAEELPENIRDLPIGARRTITAPAPSRAPISSDWPRGSGKSPAGSCCRSTTCPRPARSSAALRSTPSRRATPCPAAIGPM